MSMSQKVREEMLPRLRQRYVGRGKKGKQALISEVCEQWGYSRKHAIKLLNARAGWGGKVGSKRGRKTTYGSEVEEVYWRLWQVTEQACGKRLVALRELWLPYYEKEYGVLAKELRAKVLQISAAQIDRLLAGRKLRSGFRGRAGTKPGGLLKNQIPIRTSNWDITEPGYLEADTVAHCGTSLEGDFIWSVTYTDLCSGWTSNRAVWNKGAEGIVTATREVETKLPFALLGFDCDNGSEFLNWHLVRYFQDRTKVVGFTRSRPYHKDDNGHVEQKNWTHVRQLLGYERLADPELIPLINQLYQEVWEPLHNYFLPSMKLTQKDRLGAKIKRRHDRAQTPCDRLLAHPKVSASQKKKLRQTRASLNPFALHRELEVRLRAILQKAPHSSRPTGSLHSKPFGGNPIPTIVS
jgi:hypothetical protein